MDKFRVSPDAAASLHDDGIVILDNRSGRLFRSNRTGASIWSRIEQQVPFEAIAEEISSEYRIPQSAAREDTARFVAELERRRLIERSNHPERSNQS